MRLEGRVWCGRVPRETKRWRELYRGRAAMEGEFGRLKHEYGLPPLRVRWVERVAQMRCMLLKGPNALVVFGSPSASKTRTRDRRLAVLAASACASVRHYGPLVQADLTPVAGSPKDTDG